MTSISIKRQYAALENGAQTVNGIIKLYKDIGTTILWTLGLVILLPLSITILFVLSILLYLSAYAQKQALMTLNKKLKAIEITTEADYERIKNNFLEMAPHLRSPFKKSDLTELRQFKLIYSIHNYITPAIQVVTYSYLKKLGASS